MSWNLTISKVDNGYILDRIETLEDESKEEVFSTVFETPDSMTETEAIVPVLWAIAEYFGVINSKHDVNKLVIEHKIELE